MSYWVSLRDSDGSCVNVPRFSEGGTQEMGGSIVADLDVTYNYSPYFYEYLNKEDGLRWLDGKTALTTLTVLALAVHQLGVLTDDDYWKATKGNAGHALLLLVIWASLHPSATWHVH